MKTPLFEDDAHIRSLLLEHWKLDVVDITFIPIGDSAYSYKVRTRAGEVYYLKVVDQRTTLGRRVAAHMDFSLPLQRLIVEYQLSGVTAPLPQATLKGPLYVVDNPLLFALYTFVPGGTLADAYPMSPGLIKRIGQALGALHTVQIPQALWQRSPHDSLTAALEGGLLADLTVLADISLQDALYLQRLRELVWPCREQIRAFMAHSQEYAQKTQQVQLSSVICHGDAWGGNIILAANGQFVLLDWESSVVAPAERDAFVYGADFAAFDAGYRLTHKEPVRWHAYMLAYYSYRHQLRNLAQWLHNLLHENLDEAQRENDLEMIEFHCLDRWESVECTATALVALLDA